MGRLYKLLVRFADLIESNRILSSIKKGFILLIPILMTGSLALLIRSFPIPAFQEFLQGPGLFLLNLLNSIYDATFGLMSVLLVLSVSYYYSETFFLEGRSLQVMGMLASLAAFAASFGGMSGSLRFEHLGPIGVFTAMICAILTTKLFFVLCDRLFHRLHFYTIGADINYKSAVAAILPFLFCVVIFSLFHSLLESILHVSSLNDLISNALVMLFRNTDSNLGSGLLFTFVLNLLWMLGIHGGNALEQVSQAIFVTESSGSGQIISKSLMDNFAQIGGSGATICLLLALLLFSKSKNNRGLARAAAPMSFFNINELLVFGLPVVLNPIMLIPFILVPLCSLLIAYFATMIGMIPVITHTVTWTTPVLFSGYVATGSLWGAIVQLVIIVIGTAIYVPFVRLSERMQQNREASAIGKLIEEFKTKQSGQRVDFLNQHDEVGTIAKQMVSSLRADMAKGEVPVYYQPQMDLNNRLVGAEALLRWSYADEQIFPPLLVALAREDGFYDDLTFCILEQVCRDIRLFREQTLPELLVSVNISSDQLDDRGFVQRAIEIAEREGVTENLSFEVTEETSLLLFGNISANMELLRVHHIAVAIDDFSMGQTSLKYLQSNQFRYVKLDGELVRQVTKNSRSREIISSIIKLGNRLNFQVVAEYVENEEIRDILHDLGCQYFQGYLYSPAITPGAFIAYFLEHTGK